MENLWKMMEKRLGTASQALSADRLRGVSRHPTAFLRVHEDQRLLLMCLEDLQQALLLPALS